MTLNFRTLLVVCGVLILTGCSQKFWYNTLQNERIDDCEVYSDYEKRKACEERATESYEDYRERRKKALEKQP